MKYILFLIVILFSNQAVALDCSKQPTCAELGYSTEDNQNCLADGYLICPFDSNYKKCVNFNCESLGFTNNDKTSWCKNIAVCPNSKDYTACIKATCQIGDVYYSDGSCGLVEDYNPVLGKIPVGVVYWVTEGGRHGKVINLKDLGRDSEASSFDPTNPYNTKHTGFYWGYRGYDVPSLPNYKENILLEPLRNRDPDLYDGKSNTAKILSASGPTDCNYDKSTKEYYQYCIPQAAQAAREFYPPKVDKTNPIVGQGQWYLPALGELMDLYGFDYNQITSDSMTSGAKGNNKTLINKTLNALKIKNVEAEKLTERYYWSSVESDKDNSWELDIPQGIRGFHPKTSYNNVDFIRVSLEF